MATKFKSPLAAEIGAASARLEDLREELRTMPGWRIGTQWHTDRAAEKHRLMIKLESLRRLEQVSR